MNANALEEQSGEHEDNAAPGVDWKRYHGEGNTLSLKHKNKKSGEEYEQHSR